MNDFDEIPTQNELNECMNKFFDNFEIDSIIDEAELISSRNTVNEIENFIKKCYLNIINREPDENGLTHYTNMIKHNAILGNQLIEILNNSDECKNKQSQNNVHDVENVIDNVKHQINNDEIDNEIDNVMNEAELISSRNTINEIEDFVTKCYYNIMNREPDKGGLVNYTNKIKHNEILGVHLIEILKESDEYKRKQPQNNVHNIENININQNIKIIPDNEQEKIDKEIEKMKNQKQIYDEKSSDEITYCMMGTNRLHEFKSYIEKALSYVDKFIFIDGGSEDGTIEYLENLKNSELYENKIEVYICPWQDKFSAQRNNYLDKLRERNYKGWVLVSDTDEHFTEETFKELRNLIEKAEKENYNGIKFQVEDVMTKDIDGNNKITKTLNEYWKGLLFRFYPDVKYKGEPHETLIGAHYEWMNTNFTYKHNRSQSKVYERACLTPDSLIITSDGLKEIKNVEINDLVYSHDGKFHGINNIIKREIDEEIYILKPHKGLPIHITGDHRIFAIKTKQCSKVSKTLEFYSCRKGRKLKYCLNCEDTFYKNYKSEWIPIKNLTKNDFLVFPKPKMNEYEPGNIISPYYIEK